MARAVRRLSPKTVRIFPPKEGLLRLRFAGALRPRTEGFLGVDSVASESVDYVISIKSVPWPIEDAIVDTIFVEDYLYTLTRTERFDFMNECGRVLKVGSQLIVKEPNWSSMKSVSDPMAEWPPLSAASFVYYNKEWREREKKDNYPITCDFDFGYGHGLDGDVQLKNQEYQEYATKYLLNAAIDIHVTLTKKS